MSAKKNAKYKYEDQLTFLLPCFEEKHTINNISVEVDCQIEEGQQTKFDPDHMLYDEEKADSVLLSHIKQREEILGEPQKKRLKSSMSAISIPTSKWKSKPTETTTSMLMKYILDKSERNLGISKKTDAVDAFLAGLAPTLKSFTPYYLNLAKSKIFAAVQEYEMEMILENQKNSQIKELMVTSGTTRRSFTCDDLENVCKQQNSSHTFIECSKKMNGVSEEYSQNAPEHE